MSRTMYNSKAHEAISSTFRVHKDIVLKKVQTEAKKLCKSFRLDGLFRSIEKNTKEDLDLFFSAKTHKPECTLRVIVSQNTSWQKHVATFLQDYLKLLPIEEPYLVTKSEQLVEFFKDWQDRNLVAFSIDLNDLYYSLPQSDLMKCVTDCTDKFRAVRFQNASGMNFDNFLEHLSFYVNSTYTTWEGSVVKQKDGICIGSCIARC